MIALPAWTAGTWLRVAAACCIGVAIVTAVTLSWRHYTGLLEQVEDLTEQANGLQTLATEQRARADALELAIGSWDRAAAVQAGALRDLTQAQEGANRTQRALNAILSRHDLGALAARKPGLVEARVNRGAADAGRMFERATDPSLAGDAVPGRDVPAPAGAAGPQGGVAPAGRLAR